MRHCGFTPRGNYQNLARFNTLLSQFLIWPLYDDFVKKLVFPVSQLMLPLFGVKTRSLFYEKKSMKGLSRLAPPLHF